MAKLRDVLFESAYAQHGSLVLWFIQGSWKLMAAGFGEVLPHALPALKTTL
jgi:hypothetical protein